LNVEVIEWVDKRYLLILNCFLTFRLAN